jgi:MFS family permease
MPEVGRNEVTISRHAWFTLAILSSTLLVVFFSETMLLPAIPEIMKDFGISYGTAAWIFSAYLIVAAVMTPIAGKMSDIYGKKIILIALLSMYLIGIVAGAFANNISFLLASRIIQGLGLAAVPAAFSLLRDTGKACNCGWSVWIGIFSGLGSRIVSRGNYYPTTGMAFNILFNSTICGSRNNSDLQICKGK